MATSKTNVATATVPNDLEPYWMPFTANRAFKARPRLVVRAKDMHYFTAEGRKLIDGSRAVVHQCRPQPRSDRGGDPAPGGRARLRAGVPVFASQGVRAGEPRRLIGARRPRSCVCLLS